MEIWPLWVCFCFALLILSFTTTNASSLRYHTINKIAIDWLGRHQPVLSWYDHMFYWGGWDMRSLFIFCRQGGVKYTYGTVVHQLMNKHQLMKSLRGVQVYSMALYTIQLYNPPGHSTKTESLRWSLWCWWCPLSSRCYQFDLPFESEVPGFVVRCQTLIWSFWNTPWPGALAKYIVM